MGECVSLFREPDAGKLPVRFDEREQETGPSQTGLRGRGESRVTHPPGGYRYCACSRLYSPFHSKPVVESRPFRLQLAIAVGIHRDENVPERGRQGETQFGVRLLKVDFSEVYDAISFVEKPFHEKVLR